MTGRTGRLIFLLAVLQVVAMIGAAPAQAGGTRTYDVTIRNLTVGQPLSPPLLATHRGNYELFSPGASATHGLQQLAENWNQGPLRDELAGTRGVFDVQSSHLPLAPPSRQANVGLSNSITIKITAGKGARFLTVASMLMCTNDGFTSTGAPIQLPRVVGEPLRTVTMGWDAGTEVNTEAWGDLVDACQMLMNGPGVAGSSTTNAALAENGTVHHHGGIHGGGDLGSFHGFADPIAEVTVLRVS